MLELYPSTVRMGKFSLNLVLRATLVALTWTILLLIGLLFNLLLNYALDLAGAHDSVKEISSAVVLVFVFSLMGAATVTALADMFIFVKAVLTDSPKIVRAEKDQDCD